MARGRMLNNSICASFKLHQLPDDTCRLMATWIISFLDKNGVFYADPAMVKSMIFPRRADLTIEQVEFYLEQLQSTGLIQLFEAEGQRWQYWPGFTDNQTNLRPERERTDFPPPPDTLHEPAMDGNEPDDNRNDTGTLPEKSRKRADKMTAEKNLKEINNKGPKTALMDTFIDLTGIQLPKNKTDSKYWWARIGAIYETAQKDVDVGKRLIKLAIGEMREKELDVYDPGSIVKTVRRLASTKNGAVGGEVARTPDGGQYV